MSYPASLRQQTKWIREALDPNTEASMRIGMEDIDLEEIDAAADYIDVLVETLEVIAGSKDKLQALQAKAALDNIGAKIVEK